MVFHFNGYQNGRACSSRLKGSVYARHLRSFCFQIFQCSGVLIAIKLERAVQECMGQQHFVNYEYLITVSGGIKHRVSSMLHVNEKNRFLYLLCFTLICTEAKDANVACPFCLFCNFFSSVVFFFWSGARLNLTAAVSTSL